jgi:ABC-type dipeptide/oligopeptide/nickel transport system permease subunit
MITIEPLLEVSEPWVRHRFVGESAGAGYWRARCHVEARTRELHEHAAVMVAASISFTLLAVAGLGFLGLGVQPPGAEWGAMLTDGRTYIVNTSLVILVPGLAIFLAALAANLVGDALRDALDPNR